MSDVPPPPPMGGREDRASARADAAAAKARAKAMRPWYKKKRFIIPLVLVALIAIGAAMGGDDDEDTATGGASTTSGAKSDFSTNEKNPPAKDVTITKCELGEFDEPVIQLTIVNNSSKTSDYLISLGIEDAEGNKIGDGGASQDNVRPGQKATVDGFATISGDPPARFTCVLEEVERFAS